MEISTMRNCSTQDLQAAAKIAQKLFFNSSASTKDSFLLFPGARHSVTPAEISPVAASWAVPGSPVTPTLVLWEHQHHTRVQGLSRTFVTQSVNPGIYYTVFIFLTLSNNAFVQVRKIDFTRPTLNWSCSSLQPNMLSRGQNKKISKCREDKLPEGYTYFTAVSYCCLHFILETLLNQSKSMPSLSSKDYRKNE